MKFTREQAEGRNSFTGYGEGYVEVNHRRHVASLLVTGDRVVSDWPVAGVAALAPAQLEAIAAMGPEIVLLGTGARFVFPDPGVLAPLHAARIGVEVMDTPAACRTYNILLAEGRNVVAALILDAT